jgi:hypothetical protein
MVSELDVEVTNGPRICRLSAILSPSPASRKEGGGEEEEMWS